MTDVPKSHPRYVSLVLRDRIVAGVEAGITSLAEAFRAIGLQPESPAEPETM